MASKIEVVQAMTLAIVNDKVLAAPALRDGAMVAVGRYQEAVGGKTMYAVIRKGDTDRFGSPLSAAVHFMALVGALATAVEIDGAEIRWPR